MLSSTERQPETEPNVTADSMANHRAQRDMLSRLPPELLELILEYISDNKDAASVRMVSRSFSQLAGATRQLFQSIGVHPTNRSVSRLESISRHQSIRLHVQGIVFFPPLCDPEGLSEYFAADFGLSSIWPPCEYNSLGELHNEENPLESYRQAYDEQQHVLGSNEAMVCSSLAIGSLPNLAHVTFEDDWQIWASEPDGRSRWNPDASRRYLNHLLWTIICIGAQIKLLKLPLCGPGDVLQELIGKKSVRLKRFLDGIEELGLEVQDLDGAPREARKWDQGRPLSRLLRGLELVNLPRLRSLRLSRVGCEYGDNLDQNEYQCLASFLDWHRSTLNSVALFHLSFRPKHWRDLLRILRWKCNLKRCHIMGVGDKFIIDLLIGTYVVGGPWTKELSNSLGPEPVEEVL